MNEKLFKKNPGDPSTTLRCGDCVHATPMDTDMVSCAMYETHPRTQQNPIDLSYCFGDHFQIRSAESATELDEEII